LSEQAVRQGKLAGLQAWFDQLPSDTDPGSAKHAAVDHVWWRLAKSDFDAATGWVRSHADDPWRSDRGIAEVARRLSEDDPQSALKWLDDMRASPGDGNYPGLNKVVASWAQRDPAALENWLTKPNGGALREQASHEYGAYLTRVNPSAAARWLPPGK
jgi:hypothetical protein